MHQKLNLALERCSFPTLKSKNAYRKLGAGAWHDAYLVYPQGEQPLVIRLRKKVIYGRRETFDERYLHEDYAPVGLYYGQANRVRPGICPTIYAYRLAPDLSFTLESYMGPALALPKLTVPQACDYGRQVGAFFRALHGLPPPVDGFGDLIWDGHALSGKSRGYLSEFWQAETDLLYEQLDRLSRSKFSFNRTTLKSKLDEVLAERPAAGEPVTLVNGDITPENLISRRGRFAGLVDPVPAVHNGHRYAGFFIYCYKSYLPSLADAPRYARHQFQAYRAVMNALADGYLAGYTQGDLYLEQRLCQEYFLWAVDVAVENLRRVTAKMDTELYLRAGDTSLIAARLQRCLRELEHLSRNMPPEMGGC